MQDYESVTRSFYSMVSSAVDSAKERASVRASQGLDIYYDLWIKRSEGNDSLGSIYVGEEAPEGEGWELWTERVVHGWMPYGRWNQSVIDSARNAPVL